MLHHLRLPHREWFFPWLTLLPVGWYPRTEQNRKWKNANSKTRKFSDSCLAKQSFRKFQEPVQHGAITCWPWTRPCRIGYCLGNFSKCVYSASKRLSVRYTCRIMCMYVYLYIHIIFGDVLCLLSQSISPLVNQPNKIFQIYEKTVQDSSSVKLHFRQLPSVIIRSFFLGFYWFPQPGLVQSLG